MATNENITLDELLRYSIKPNKKKDSVDVIFIRRNVAATAQVEFIGYHMEKNDNYYGSLPQDGKEDIKWQTFASDGGFSCPSATLIGVKADCKSRYELIDPVNDNQYEVSLTQIMRLLLNVSSTDCARQNLSKFRGNKPLFKVLKSTIERIEKVLTVINEMPLAVDKDTLLQALSDGNHAILTRYIQQNDREDLLRLLKDSEKIRMWELLSGVEQTKEAEQTKCTIEDHLIKQDGITHEWPKTLQSRIVDSIFEKITSLDIDSNELTLSHIVTALQILANDVIRIPEGNAQIQLFVISLSHGIEREDFLPAFISLNEYQKKQISMDSSLTINGLCHLWSCVDDDAQSLIIERLVKDHKDKVLDLMALPDRLRLNFVSYLFENGNLDLGTVGRLAPHLEEAFGNTVPVQVLDQVEQCLQDTANRDLVTLLDLLVRQKRDVSRIIDSMEADRLSSVWVNTEADDLKKSICLRLCELVRSEKHPISVHDWDAEMKRDMVQRLLTDNQIAEMKRGSLDFVVPVICEDVDSYQNLLSTDSVFQMFDVYAEQDSKEVDMFFIENLISHFLKKPILEPEQTKKMSIRKLVSFWRCNSDEQNRKIILGAIAEKLGAINHSELPQSLAQIKPFEDLTTQILNRWPFPENIATNHKMLTEVVELFGSVEISRLSQDVSVRLIRLMRLLADNLNSDDVLLEKLINILIEMGCSYGGQLVNVEVIERIWRLLPPAGVADMWRERLAEELKLILTRSSNDECGEAKKASVLRFLNDTSEKKSSIHPLYWMFRCASSDSVRQKLFSVLPTKVLEKCATSAHTGANGDYTFVLNMVDGICSRLSDEMYRVVHYPDSMQRMPEIIEELFKLIIDLPRDIREPLRWRLFGFVLEGWSRASLKAHKSANETGGARDFLDWASKFICDDLFRCDKDLALLTVGSLAIDGHKNGNDKIIDVLSDYIGDDYSRLITVSSRLTEDCRQSFFKQYLKKKKQDRT